MEFIEVLNAFALLRYLFIYKSYFIVTISVLQLKL